MELSRGLGRSGEMLFQGSLQSRPEELGDILVMDVDRRGGPGGRD